MTDSRWKFSTKTKVSVLFKLPLYCQIIIAIAAGVLFGCFAWQYISYVDWIGTIFLNLLKMIVLPLLFTLLISSITNIESGKSLGRLGMKTILFYTITTLLAIITGLILVTLIKPGQGIDLSLASELPEDLKKGQGMMSDLSFKGILLGIVPSNVFKALADGNVLPVVFFAIFTGCFLVSMDNKEGHFLRNFFESGASLMMKMTTWIIQLAPYGVFAMIAKNLSVYEGDPTRLITIAKSVGLFFVTVLAGLGIQMFITLSVILLLFRINPFKHLVNMFVPLVTAFSTATSNATIPFSLQALEENDGVSRKISNFTIPLGATLNMNGTALYECVIVLFISQAYGIELTFAQMVIVTLTALLSAVGTPGIPMASLVMITIVLNAVGLPVEGIGLILVTDRILDMCRTTVNIYGDTCCTACIAKTEGEKLNV